MIGTVRAWYGIHRGWVGYLAIFVIAFLVFAHFQYSTIFADPDSFYHTAVSVLMRDGTFHRVFTALPYTTLATAYADQHFLYHLLLVPFVSIADPLVGMKLATIAFGALLALTFYWFLRRWGIRWAFITTIVLLLVNPFSFRMNLAKASSLSLMLLLLGLAAAFSYRTKLLSVLAFAFVWFYGGFPLLVGSVVAFAVIGAIHRRVHRSLDAVRFVDRIRSLLGRRFRTHRPARSHLWLAVAVVAGTALGLILNPFFPQNISFYYDQLIRIGIVNYQHTIGVGGEWYPYHLIDLIANTVLVSIPLVVAIVVAAVTLRRQSARSITLFFLWLFFFLLTLKSRRYIEYEVPFGLLSAAFALHDALDWLHWKEVKAWMTTLFRKNRWAWFGLVALTAYLVALVPTIVIRDFVSEKKDLENGFPMGLLSSESTWIRDHGAPGAIVFHSDWDIFPVLYYYNPSGRYIAGLDPTFLYLTNPDRYWQWAHVTLGTETGDVHDIVRNTFHADFVIIEHDHEAMDRLIAADSGFQLAYDGPDAKVYSVR